MTEHIAHLSHDVDICYETFGNPEHPAALLVMGLGCPMGWWSVEFCERLQAQGFFVIRFDNRDTGRSTKLRDAGPVSRKQLISAFLGRPAKAPYAIADMARDALGLLDHLAIEQAHVVGVSMGGMIAQTTAIDAPARVLSLTSIMSTTGRRAVGWQHPRLLPGLLKPAGRTRDSYIARSLLTAKMMRSPGYEFDEPFVVTRAEETFDRGWSASGVVRQMMAVLTQPDRTAALRRLQMPTCVIHGLSDPMVHSSGGRATAGAIEGAELVTMPGMGHDMPKETHRAIVDAIVRTAARAHAHR